MILTFGRHQGEEIKTVPMSYLWSIWEDGISNPAIREAVRARIEPERYVLHSKEDFTPSGTQLRALAREVFGKLSR